MLLNIRFLKDVRRAYGYGMSGIQVRLPDRKRDLAKRLAAFETNARGIKVKESDIYRSLILNGLELMEEKHADQLVVTNQHKKEL